MVTLSPIHLASTITKGKFQHPLHIRLLAYWLKSVACGQTEGLVVCMPPRHGKSETISRFFPAWFLGRWPDKRVMLASHEAQIASSWGRKAREILETWGMKYFGLSIRSDSRAKAHWDIDGYAGGMDTAGVGGSFTGRGAHLFIVDDPIKNSKEAQSETHRNAVWDLWQSTLETRAEPGCGFVLVQTRWHKDDLAGRVIKEIQEGNRKNWKVLKFPALAGREDPLGRSEGEPLWPERYPKEKIEAIQSRWNSDEARMGPYWFEALYQQEPTPREGGLFKRKWFKYYGFDDENVKLSDGRVFKKKDCWKFFVVDLAISQKTTADYFCLGVWMVTADHDLLLWDCIHDRIPGPDQSPLIAKECLRHRPSFITVEANAYQMSLVQDLLRKGLPAKELIVDKDKMARAQLGALLMKDGRIHLRQNAPWLREYENELAEFPNAEHDDFVDITSMAANELSGVVMPTVG